MANQTVDSTPPCLIPADLQNQKEMAPPHRTKVSTLRGIFLSGRHVDRARRGVGTGRPEEAQSNLPVEYGLKVISVSDTISLTVVSTGGADWGLPRPVTFSARSI